MKILIIGAGFTGLSAGYELSKKGHDVIIVEKETHPGGLAIGFKKNSWKWSLEEHYHHIFSSDRFIQKLGKQVGVDFIFSKPKTSLIYNGKIYQVDDPLSLLKFPCISLFDRIRTGAIIFYLKITPFWKSLEKVTARSFLIKYMGKSSWKVLWEPLFMSKFGRVLSEIPASWFWARIKKRSSSLGYPIGGFLKLSEKIAENIIKNKGTIIYKTQVTEIKKNGKFRVKLSNQEEVEVDKVICTLPAGQLIKITKDLPEYYIASLVNLKGLGVVTLVLTLKKSILTDGTYWLNINDISFPFTAYVEHTNFVKPEYYNNEIIAYIAKYVPPTHKYMDYNADKLLDEFLPYLKKLNPEFDRSWISDKFLFKSSFAQPIVPLNYSKMIPFITTPIEGLYLANMQQVYPWDRGTNYAIELGQKVAKLLMDNVK